MHSLDDDDDYYDDQDEIILCEEDAKKSVLKHSQLLESMAFRPIMSRCDPRSILHGL